MTAPVVSRLNAVTYGGFAVGTTSDYHLHGVTVSEHSYTTCTVAFQVFVNHDTRSTFVGYCTALEAAFRKPNGDLSVTINGTTWLTFSQSSNTGMLAQPSIRKAGGGADSNNSRIYDCSVTVMLPADETGKSGRLSSTVTVTEDGAEALHLDVSAVYTALSTSAAATQAQSAFPTYVSGLQTTWGGTWDESSAITYAHDSDNKVCRCRASYRQILAAQSQEGLNHASLQGVWTEVTTDRGAIGADPGGTAPLVKISVRFSCTVRSSVSTDILTLYTGTVRPHMIAIAQSYSDSATAVTAIMEQPGLRPQSNSIQARMVFLAAGGSSLVRADTNVAMIEVMPYFFVPVLDGEEFSRDKHSRPGYRGAAVVSTVLILGTDVNGGGANPFAAADAEVARLQRKNYHVVERREPTFKRIEFDGMGISGKLTLLAVKRDVLMEKAIIREGTHGHGLRTQTRDLGRGNVFGSRAGRSDSYGWID